MGRSISYPTGALVCFTVFECDSPDQSTDDLEWFAEDCRTRAREAFASLLPFDGWRGREDRVLARNAYADFGISSLGSMVAVWIVERNDGSYSDHDVQFIRSPRAVHWLRQIAPRFDALFGDYDRLGHMSNGEGVYRKRARP